MSRRHDQSYKLLFSLPLAVEQLIRRFIHPDLADELDFERVENLATERTTQGLTRSHADLLWKIHFLRSSRFMLLPIEFQSAVDRYMAVRVLYYVAIAYHGLISKRGRAKKLAPGGLLPPVLAVTIYNGRKAWTAPNDVFDLIEPVQGWLSRRQPRLRHHVLDLRTLARQPLPESNVVSWIARMERDSLAENVSRVVQEVLEKYPGPEHRITLVCRQARLKFGSETAERLSRLLEGITDAERIARIGDRIIECETGAALLAQAREA